MPWVKFYFWAICTWDFTSFMEAAQIQVGVGIFTFIVSYFKKVIFV